MSKKILMLVGDFAEDYEVMVPFQALLAVGHTVHAVCPAVAPEVRLAGAAYADIGIDKAITDGNLVTAPAWPAHPAWIAQFLQVLGTRIVDEEPAAMAH